MDLMLDVVKHLPMKNVEVNCSWLSLTYFSVESLHVFKDHTMATNTTDEIEVVVPCNSGVMTSWLWQLANHIPFTNQAKVTHYIHRPWVPPILMLTTTNVQIRTCEIKSNLYPFSLPSRVDAEMFCVALRLYTALVVKSAINSTGIYKLYPGCRKINTKALKLSKKAAGMMDVCSSRIKFHIYLYLFKMRVANYSNTIK